MVSYSAEYLLESEELDAFHQIGLLAKSRGPFAQSQFNQKSSGVVLMRVFQGSIDCHQIDPFKSAFCDHVDILRGIVSPKRIEVEYKTVKHVCEDGWTIEELFDWLLSSSIHIILTHVHQGFASHNVFLDMHSVMRNMMRLNHHIGFPSGNQLYCPVLTQDKFRYIACLSSMSIPSMKIDIVPCDGCNIDEGLSQRMKR